MLSALLSHCAASLSTLATYLKGATPGAIQGALAAGTFQALLDLRRTLHLSAATIGYLQAFVQSARNPKQARLPPKWAVRAGPTPPSCIDGCAKTPDTRCSGPPVHSGQEALCSCMMTLRWSNLCWLLSASQLPTAQGVHSFSRHTWG